ncbi:riboflavin biosynthesis protein [Pilimelia anulata]|uniref:Riboflavin biosynthesis protein n=1 Tax=Pilimelia anulata TaxID=53371 RepID=A0A8J3F7I7_9ACTN|nr:bifunctional riboflavin kinase/FAD synthetase [Pilimelia anulata]GGJ77157.1 riboflavin biosynthesis protein [Pilimelia anulata]
MQRWRGLGAVPAGWGRSVVGIGVFDGVHRGHRATIGHAVAEARARRLRSVIVTFDPHPAEVVRPGAHPAVLTSATRKAELIAELGVDALWVLPFTREFSRLPPEEFVYDVLVERLHTALVVVGENFRFGHRAAGDVALLDTLGRRFGFAVEGAPLVGAATAPPPAAVPPPAAFPPPAAAGGAEVFSSTYIRACVAAGDVAAAAAALGRAHRIEGVVVRGDRRGRELGFPTANLLCEPHAALPADGVYAAWLVRPDGTPVAADGPPALRAAVSIGTNPTFRGDERRVEAYALDFAGDLYGERLALDFVARLRGQETFARVEDLVTTIGDDVARTRTLLG